MGTMARRAMKLTRKKNAIILPIDGLVTFALHVAEVRGTSLLSAVLLSIASRYDPDPPDHTQRKHQR
jgi:hypothetical protein